MDEEILLQGDYGLVLPMKDSLDIGYHHNQMFFYLPYLDQ